MELVKKLQEDLLKQIHSSRSLPESIVQAYYHYPRHEFVPENYSVVEAYRDRALNLYKVGEEHSTISQPSFVLYLLDLLDLKPGQKVFEVGTGSGWNAALMSDLVGPAGKIVTMEIIPSLAKTAREILKDHGVTNVEVIEGDASQGWSLEAPYDRMIFTAAAPQVPHFLLEQCREEGKVLFVYQGVGHDEMWLLKKIEGQFKRLQTIPCHFVSMTGAVRDEPSKSKSPRRRNQ